MVMEEKWDGLHTQKRFRPRYPSEHVVRFLFTHFPADRREQLKILDLGCGGGRHTIVLASEGFQTYATDISKEGIKHTNAWLGELGLKAVVKKASMEKQPFPEGFFDGVIAFGVIYYNNLNGLKKTVAEINRILKTGGQALIYTKTTEDRRYGKSEPVEKNMFVINDMPDTGEQGMTMCLIGEEDINDLFQSFSRINVERTETTVDNLREKDSEWIITLTK
jgi:SAM-dependent methyltransferase